MPEKKHHVPALVGITLTIASIVVGILHRFVLPIFHCQFSSWVGHSLVAAWIIGPPVWFSIEWHRASSPQSKNQLQPEKLEVLAHTHELDRNIWLALVVILAALFKVSWASFGG